MKQIVKWRQFLHEDRMGPYQIYCDMDGVLVDFVRGALEQMNRDVQDATLDDKESSGRYNALGKLKLTMERAGIETLEEKHIEKNSDGPRELRKVAIKYMYERLWDDEEFWANLPWMPGGKSLWETVRSYNPYILTAPMGEGSERGKQRWIDKNLNPQPSKVFMSHDKFNWAKDGERQNVLIDDFISNIKPWRKSGGIAIHHDHEDVQQTLSSLSDLGFKTKPIPNEHTEDNEAEEKEEALPLLEERVSIRRRRQKSRQAHKRLTVKTGGKKRSRRSSRQKE